ncbi:MAG: trypsin-like peptidase domain-containing protein [Candidatus Hatepunaea meridiana]|nr:trypsin-like peptidase domain-containing protein [Candidatus Hatepunaea meridiana]
MPDTERTGRGVKYQHLRDFTVQIRYRDSEDIAGTGFLVSTHGEIVTCAHVVEAVIGCHPRDTDDTEVQVYFPQSSAGQKRVRNATVKRVFPKHDDDIVLLELKGGTSPIDPEKIAILGDAEHSAWHGFHTYGFPSLKPYSALWAFGDIVGKVYPPDERKLLTEPVQMDSKQIDLGMSGAPVLDTDSNLIIGVVTETYYPGQGGKNPHTCWATDNKALTFIPFNFKLRQKPLPLQPVTPPKTDIAKARGETRTGLDKKLVDAPEPLPQWVGRKEQLKSIGEDWLNDKCRVTGLIGFGGEGKSTLARRWMDDMLSDTSQPQPDGVFWWGFYTNPSVDEFFESALKYLSEDKVDPKKLGSASEKAKYIWAMLGSGRYLFVLDGLEVMQHQDGNDYGSLRSGGLRDFLKFIADPGHNSYCLITSRAPVIDLVQFNTYRHRSVSRLTDRDGIDLLKEYGVKGADTELKNVVKDWDGHALVLSLIATLLAEIHGGDIKQIGDIPLPTEDEDRYTRVHRVLRRYDDHLNDAERSFMKLFSAFRTPVAKKAFKKVFRTRTSDTAINAAVADLRDSEFDNMIDRLQKYGIIRYSEFEKHYTTHPLIRAHYFTLLNRVDKRITTEAHTSIKDFYLDVAGRVPYNPTLNDLKPLIEVVYHLCRAGAYDEAFYDVFRKQIHQGNKRVLSYQLNAFYTQYSILKEFFPDRDTNKEPLVSDENAKAWIISSLGFCQNNLGNLSDAIPFFERGSVHSIQLEDWEGASADFNNLTDTYSLLGRLSVAERAAQKSSEFAEKSNEDKVIQSSRAHQAHIRFLVGDTSQAGVLFKQAQELEKKIDPDKVYLYSFRGIQHTEYLIRIDDNGYASRVNDANHKICERNHWHHNICQCHRLSGELDAIEGKQETAGDHFDRALKIARSIDRRDVLIEALLGRGHWLAKQMQDAAGAFNDLNEALDYALEGGYRVYEADIRVALAWAHHANGDPDRTNAEAKFAKEMSEEMGYHWGRVDAEEILRIL